ncbi:hypothetical protein JCM10207_006734 [Rhodosporidiobolus poonsookiae]
MDALKATSIPSMRLSRSHGSASSSSSPLAGSLHLTTHHLIFEPEHADKNSTSSQPGPSTGALKGASGKNGATSNGELWIPLPLLLNVTRTPPTLTGSPSPLVLRTRDFVTYELHFSTTDEADSVWDSLKGLCQSFSAGGLENRYAFFCKGAQADKKGKGKTGWAIYNPAEEFARMGVGSRSKAWRFSSINADFQFCPSYPAELVVPARISDNTLTYAVKYRSKSRIPGLVYLHWANLGSITRSSQPMVGFHQHSRSIQDEKLVECIFTSHSQHSHALQPMAVSDRSSSPGYADSSAAGASVYGARAANIIIDARPGVNAYANSVKGAGTENMKYYKNCEKEYLGIDNIHVMRSSLSTICAALVDAETTGRLDRAALRRSNWLSHLTNILDGTLIIIRTVHINNSHALVHCSDGWDRTSQLSALPQLCLDPFFRTTRGFAVLIEKDWVSYGHRFADRSGHLCNDRVEFVSKLGDDASAQQSVLASVTKQFAGSSHAFKETCPVFQQYLDCVYQIMRQFPDRFEFNEKLLRHLVTETYAGNSGTFLLNSEKDRAELRARERTSSVWETVFDVDDDGTLSPKPEFRNPAYNPSKDDPKADKPDSDQGCLLPNSQDVKWWFELFGRSDDEMNGRPEAGDPGALPQHPTVTEHTVVQSSEDDPVLNPLSAAASKLSLSASSSPAASSASLAAPPPSTSRSPSPAAARNAGLELPNQQQLSETVASVQKLGWSAFKAVRKFGEDAARQYKEAADARAAAAAEEEQRNGGHAAEGSSGSWRAIGRSEDGVSELADGAGWGGTAPVGSHTRPAAPSSAAGQNAGGGLGSLGKSAGSMWSKFSSSNPWAASESSAPRDTPSSLPPSSATPAYQPYQPRTARVDPSVLDPSIPTSRPPAPAPRQPSSTLSINPWESISRDELAPAPAPPPAPPVEPVKETSGTAGDPLGVGL